MTFKSSAIIYATQYGYFDFPETITEIEQRQQVEGCEENQRALMTAYRRVKRQLTKCGYRATKDLVDELKGIEHVKDAPSAPDPHFFD